MIYHINQDFRFLIENRNVARRGNLAEWGMFARIPSVRQMGNPQLTQEGFAIPQLRYCNLSFKLSFYTVLPSIRRYGISKWAVR